MFGWPLTCFFCLMAWRLEVMASPTRHYPEDRAGLIPTHLLEYSRPPVESTPLQIQNSSAQDVSTLPEKYESKRKSGAIKTTRIRRTPTGFSARGFHEGVFDRDFGHFSPVKRRPEADAAGFYGDTFSDDFGTFETMKRRLPSYGFKAMSKQDMMMDPRYLEGITQRYMEGKRSPEMTKSGFHSDLFNGGFGSFSPM